VTVEVLQNELARLEREATGAISQAQDAAAVQTLRNQWLGRKGRLASLLKTLPELPPEERPTFGKSANYLKETLSSLLDTKLKELSTQAAGGISAIDLTLPGRSPWLGRKHPVTLVMDQTRDIFLGMGFSTALGPEIETEFNNFEALNTPADHPARDEQDTFYLEDGRLLRTHTSPVQIRTMLAQRPPVRIICIGRCYRRDAVDASHFPIFHQVEGLYVDEGVNFRDLIGTLELYFRRMFGAETRIRLMPHFFPFTEPSAEVHVTCVICRGRGCRTCKETGWLEIGGCGMVDPEVFKAVSYDSERYTGFAFGWGIERIAMIKYGIEDIRLFYENDLRFLEQF